jgi:hypothetical protein
MRERIWSQLGRQAALWTGAAAIVAGVLLFLSNLFGEFLLPGETAGEITADRTARSCPGRRSDRRSLPELRPSAGRVVCSEPYPAYASRLIFERPNTRPARCVRPLATEFDDEQSASRDRRSSTNAGVDAGASQTTATDETQQSSHARSSLSHPWESDTLIPSGERTLVPSSKEGSSSGSGFSSRRADHKGCVIMAGWGSLSHHAS